MVYFMKKFTSVKLVRKYTGLMLDHCGFFFMHNQYACLMLDQYALAALHFRCLLDEYVFLMHDQYAV